MYCDDLKKLILRVDGPRAAAVRAASPVEVPGFRSLTDAEFDELATGQAGAAVVARLGRAQLALRVGLLGALRERIGGQPGWEVIAQLDAHHPAAFDAVLAHPFVRTWATKLLSKLDQAQQPQSAADLGYPAAIAAAAAIRAGIDATVELPLHQGAVYLPTVGRLDLSRLGVEIPSVLMNCAEGGFTVVANGHAVTVASCGEASADGAWQPVWRLRAADGFECALDDLDPYRDDFQWPVTARLDDASAMAWQRSFAGACALLEADYPMYGPGLRAGLSTLTPLTAPRMGSFSASAAETYGAIGAALPQDSATLALLLVHEWQHVRLWALYDLYPLFDPMDRRLHYAAWRDDPRPLSAVLQGTFAHVGVTDYWRIRRLAAPDAQERAEAAVQFARWRQMTADALGALAATGSMTRYGVRLLDALRTTIEPWLAEAVPPEARAAGRLAAERHRTAWLRANAAAESASATSTAPHQVGV